jgi:hypothetical protein
MFLFGAFIAATLHSFDRPVGEWNILHPGVEIRYKLDHERIDLIGGIFVNSEDAISLYGGFRFDLFPDTQSIPLTLDAGLVSGYTGGAVLPMLRVTWDLDEAGMVKAFAMPAVAMDSLDEINDVGFALGLQIMMFN